MLGRFELSKITESARGEDCSIRLPGRCLRLNDTVVWAHANGSAAGKGFGMKTPDALGAYACQACHDTYDRRLPLPEGMTREEVEIAFHEGHQRSYQILLKKGLVKES